MRRFRTTQSDSLDLLLDTICNAFGGIVLIAILITLLTSDTKEKLEEAATTADKELIERQIASLKSDIKEAEEYLQRQASSVSVDPVLVARLDRAKASLQTAKDKNSEVWSAWQKAAAKASSNDPEADKVLGEKVSVASRLARLRTETEAFDQKLERLKQRLETLGRERSDIVASKTEQLRLPKEQPERSGNVYFLLKNNQVYPLWFARFGALVQNDDSLEWEEAGGDSHRVTPKAGRGVSASDVSSSLRDTLVLMKKEGKYATLSTDSKSAVVYRALRSELLKYGLPFGWEYEESVSEVFTTGPNGSKPPPL
jgi:cell division protein ZapA (FtsZ GTPase activity inhibitor)